jgi:hypothetical protein
MRRILFLILFFAFSYQINSYSAKVCLINEEYNLIAIDVGKDANIVRGTKIRIYDTDNKNLKATAVVESVGKLTSIARILNQKRKIIIGDNVAALNNSLILNKYKIDTIKIKRRIGINDLFKFAENLPEIEKERVDLELIKDNIQISQSRFFPKIILQWVKAKALQEGRRIQGGYIIDPIIDIAEAWFFLPFYEIANKKYYLTLYEKQQIQLEKKKAEIFEEISKNYIDYIELGEKIKIKERYLSKIKQIEQILKDKERVFPYILKRLKAEISNREMDLSSLKIERKQILDSIKLLINLNSNDEISLKEMSAQFILQQLAEKIKFPKGGFDLTLAKVDKEIKKSEYLIAKLKIRPEMKLKIGYPSYVFTFLVSIPIEGKSAIKTAEVSQNQAEFLIKKEENKFNYEKKKANLEIHYLKNLKERLSFLKEEYETAIKYVSRIEDKIDVLLSLEKFEIESLKLSKEKINSSLKLISLGERNTPVSVYGRKFKIPQLNVCLKKIEEKNPEIKFLNLEAKKSFVFLNEARVKHNQAKENYYKDEYAYRINQVYLKQQEITKDFISSYLNYIISYLNYKKFREKSKIYREEWKIKEKKITLRKYLKGKAYLKWLESNYTSLKKAMRLELLLLKLKMLTYSLEDKIFGSNLVEINSDYLKKIVSEVKNIEFDPKIHDRLLGLRICLAVDKIDLAKRGWWIKGPIELFYSGWPFGKGKDARDWKKIPPSLKLVTPAGVFIPLGIIYRTPFGQQIHDLRIAKTNLDIEKIKVKQEKTLLEGRRWELLSETSWRKEKLKDYKKSIKEAYLKLKQIENKLKIFQANEEDLLAQKRLILGKEIIYFNRLSLYLVKNLKFKFLGLPNKDKSKEIVTLPEAKKIYPKIQIIKKQAKIIEERYKRAKKLNLTDMFTFGIRRLGVWFLYSLYPDINLIRAKHIVKEIPYHLRRGNLESNLDYEYWLTKYQVEELKIKGIKSLILKLNNLLKRIEENVNLAITPRSQEIELREIIDKLEEYLETSEIEKEKAGFKLKYLLGIEPNAELEVKERLPFYYSWNIELLKPLSLIESGLINSPYIELASSRLELVYKEKKWDKRWRNLKLGADFLLDFIATRSYAYSISFALFDLVLRNGSFYKQDKIQLENINLCIERGKLIKDVFFRYINIQNGKQVYENNFKILQNWQNLFNPSLSTYLRKKINWEEEFGFKKLIEEIISSQRDYFENYEKFIFNLKYYRQLEKTYIEPKKENLIASSYSPFGFIDLRIFSNRVNKFLSHLYLMKKEKPFLSQREKRIEKRRQKMLKRNLSLYRYEIEKRNKKKQLDEIKNLNKNAQNIEYSSYLSIENIWKKELKDFKEIKARLSFLFQTSEEKKYIILTKEFFSLWKPNLRYYYNPFLPITETDLINAITNFFLIYLRNFRFTEYEIELFFKYLPRVTKIWNKVKKDCNYPKLGDWWMRYSNQFSYLFYLPYFKQNDLNELGILIHYTLLAVVNHEKQFPYERNINFIILSKIKERIYIDKNWIFLDLRNIKTTQVKGFLKWYDYIFKEIDKLIFKNFSYDELEEARKKLAELKIPFWKYVIGNKLDEKTQISIIHWLIGTGIKIEDWDKVFKDMEELSKIIYKLYPKPNKEDLLSLYDSVRIRYLKKIDDKQGFEIEAERVEKSYMMGIFFYWMNKIVFEEFSLKEINEITKWANFIKNSYFFKKVFGNRRITDPKYLFYTHNLIYWAEKLSRNKKKSKVNLQRDFETVLSLISWLKNEKNFKAIFGEIDFEVPYIYEKEPIQKITNYLGNLYFWAEFIKENKFSKEFVSNYFLNLNYCLKSKQFKNILSENYKLLNIKINLSLKKPTIEMRKEILGIYSNWVSYFLLRGVNTPQKIMNALHEMKEIAELAKRNQIKLSQDDLKYWHQHMEEQGYNINDLKQIFKNMKEVKNILRDAIKNIESKPKIKKEFINLIQKRKMLSGEIQRLAEEIMFKENLDYKDLLEEYSLGLYCQALYYSYFEELLSPADLTRMLDFIYSHGFSYSDVAEILKLKKSFIDWQDSLIKKLKIKREIFPVFRNEEIEQIIAEHAEKENWNKVSKEIKNYINKIDIFMKEFYYQNNIFPSKFLIYSYLSPYLLKAPNWKIKFLIKYGGLSKRAFDLRVINLGKNKNIIRELLEFSINYYLFSPDIKNYKKYLRLLKNLNQNELQFSLIKLKEIEDVLGKEILAEFETNISKSDFSKIMGNFSLEFFPYIISMSKKEKLIKARVKNLSQLGLGEFKEIIPNKAIAERLENPEQRMKIIKLIQNIYKKKTGIDISPSFLHSLFWRLREGYKVKEAIDVFVGNYQILKENFEKIFKREINGGMHLILLNFAKQVYLTPLRMSDVIGILKIANVLEKRKILGINRDFRDIIKDANSIYFSGLETAELEPILNIIIKLKKDYPELNFSFWEKIFYLLIKESEGSLYKKPEIIITDKRESLNLIKIALENINYKFKNFNKLERFYLYLFRENISCYDIVYLSFLSENYQKILKLPLKFKKMIFDELIYLRTKKKFHLNILEEKWQVIKNIENLETKNRLNSIRQNCLSKVLRKI